MTSWHPSKFLFFPRPSICYRFYRTGLAFIHSYSLPLSPANIGGCGSRCTSKLSQWSHDLEAGWLSYRQKLSAPHGHMYCGTEASLCRIPWPFLIVVFHGLSSTCCPWHLLLETRFYLLDTRSSAASGFQPQPLGICLRCLRMRSESVNTDWVWAFPQGQAGILMSFLFKRSSDVMGVWF